MPPPAPSSWTSAWSRCSPPAPSCCWTASSTPRWPTREPDARWGWSRCARSTASPPAPWSPTARCCCASRPAAGRERQRERAAQPDRLEREGEGFFEQIAAAYEELARAEPQRIRIDRRRPAAPAGARGRRSRRRRGPAASTPAPGTSMGGAACSPLHPHHQPLRRSDRGRRLRRPSDTRLHRLGASSASAPPNPTGRSPCATPWPRPASASPPPGRNSPTG